MAEDGHRPVVLIDLDRTLAEYDEFEGWTKIGRPREFAKEFVRYFKEYGWITVLWSSRPDFSLQKVWLEVHDFTDPDVGEGLVADDNGILLFDYIGTYPTEKLINPAKPLADLIIDDRTWPWNGQPVPLKELMTSLLDKGVLQEYKKE